VQCCKRARVDKQVSGVQDWLVVTIDIREEGCGQIGA
jgi:hypothetical protein